MAWQTARDDLRRYTSSADGGGGHCSDNVEGNDGTENNRNSSSEGEEQSDLLEICEAIYTALSIDAGGYGTAGFHLVSFVYIFFLAYVPTTQTAEFVNIQFPPPSLSQSIL